MTHFSTKTKIVFEMLHLVIVAFCVEKRIPTRALQTLLGHVRLTSAEIWVRFGTMRLYKKGKSHLFCGHWNGSEIEIGLTKNLKSIPRDNRRHYHPYKEYYLIIEGKGAMQVEDRIVPLSKEMLLMVDPYEKHKWHSIDPVAGIKWVIIKEKSLPDSKIIVESDKQNRKEMRETAFPNRIFP